MDTVNDKASSGVLNFVLYLDKTRRIIGTDSGYHRESLRKSRWVRERSTWHDTETALIFAAEMISNLAGGFGIKKKLVERALSEPGAADLSTREMGALLGCSNAWVCKVRQSIKEATRRKKRRGEAL